MGRVTDGWLAGWLQWMNDRAERHEIRSGSSNACPSDSARKERRVAVEYLVLSTFYLLPYLQVSRRGCGIR